MLLALMYHRASMGPWIDKYTNSKTMLRDHFMFLKEQYPLVLPGDPLPKKKALRLPDI